MKTRIISGIIMALITLCFILAGLFVNQLFICAFLMIAAAIAAAELTRTAAGIEVKTAVALGSVYSALFVFFRLGADKLYFMRFVWDKPSLSREALLAVYFIACAAIIIFRHKSFDMGRIFALTCAVPVLALGFCYVGEIITFRNGIYYILMLLAFSSGCDMGAYFTGVTIGRHKLCPEISPKKTVEGAIGGIITAMLFTLLFIFLFRNSIRFTSSRVITTVLLAVPFCLLGMAGDLLASAVKRSAGIKDYGSLIPGHGGILDRFDSILLIAPAMYLLMKYGVI